MKSMYNGQTAETAAELQVSAPVCHQLCSCLVLCPFPASIFRSFSVFLRVSLPVFLAAVPSHVLFSPSLLFFSMCQRFVSLPLALLVPPLFLLPHIFYFRQKPNPFTKGGEICKLLETTEHWWRVSLDQQEGWVLPEYLKQVALRKPPPPVAELPKKVSVAT